MLVSTSAHALQLLRLILDTPSHEGMSLTEQRCTAVLAVIADERSNAGRGSEAMGTQAPNLVRRA